MENKVGGVRIDTEYLQEFEKRVIIAGYQNGVIKPSRAQVPFGIGKLSRTRFGRIIGTRFFIPETSLVIEYYGLHKKSLHFMSCAVEDFEFSWQNWVETDLINFASLKDSHVKELAPDLLLGFPDFKTSLVRLRFDADGENIMR